MFVSKNNITLIEIDCKWKGNSDFIENLLNKFK